MSQNYHYFVDLIDASLYFSGHANYYLHLKAFDNAYMYGTATKIKHLNDFYTPTFLICSFIGLLVCALFRMRSAVVVGFLGALLLAIYFQQIPYIHGTLTLERTFISISAAVTISMGTDLLIRFIHYLVHRPRARSLNQRSKIDQTFGF